MIYDSVSVITITNRLNYINNIINNFSRQNIENKELIIIINNDEINVADYNKFALRYKNIQIYKIPQEISLGSCLNFATKKCNYPIISKFDDDDYYGPFYLDEVLKTFNKVDCQVIGKTKTYLYFEKYKKLMLKKFGYENSFVYTVLGSTLCFKIDILDKIYFRDLSLREDKYFCDDCLMNKYKIYSTSIYNHIIFKHSDIEKHTFKYNLNFLMELCTTVKDDICFEDCYLLVHSLK